MIDHILISSTSAIIGALVIQTQRPDNTQITESGTPKLDPHTPHNQLIAMVNLTSLPPTILEIPEQEEDEVQTPNQPRTEEDGKRFSDAIDSKLKNDEFLARAILPDDLRTLIKNSTKRRQAKMIHEFMTNTRANSNTNADFLVTHLEIIYTQTLGELFGWKQQKKPHHLQAYPNHPLVYHTRAAIYATNETIKQSTVSNESNSTRQPLLTAITKLTDSLTTLAEKTKKPIDVWLNPHAAPFRLLALNHKKQKPNDNLLHSCCNTRILAARVR